jgi:hypothetical protein
MYDHIHLHPRLRLAEERRMSVVLGRKFVWLAISWMSKLAAARLGAHAPPSAEAQTHSFVRV